MLIYNINLYYSVWYILLRSSETSFSTGPNVQWILRQLREDWA